MYKKNELKNLIYIQENKACNEQTVKGLFRSIVEPILEENVESLVLCRLEDKSKNDFGGVLKRLEYANAKVYDFSDKPIGDKFENVLNEKIWGKTEFVYILTSRYGAVLIFDYEECEMENFAQFYILHNSKNLSDAFGVINSNSTVDLKSYEETWHPERRDNGTMNRSIRKIVENLNETNQEFMIAEMANEHSDKDSDSVAQLEFLLTKSSYIAHEMRNLLSICNLYSTIIEKQADKVKFENAEVEKSITNARECIKKSLKMTGNLLLDFKSLKSVDLREYDLQTLLKSAIELAQAYTNGKTIQIKSEIELTSNVLVDENKFLAVLINLIKNAVESIEEVGEIVVKSKIEDENAKIIISNNGNPISREIQSRIFEQGFTTKPTGSGVGLVICKKTLEEQFAQLKLTKSDEVSTEFEITVLKGGK